MCDDPEKGGKMRSVEHPMFKFYFSNTIQANKDLYVVDWQTSTITRYVDPLNWGEKSEKVVLGTLGDRRFASTATLADYFQICIVGGMDHMNKAVDKVHKFTL